MSDALPRLELAELASPFDEALLLIDGREEETIRIECEGARRLARRIATIVNTHELVVQTLEAAAAALRDFGAPQVAENVDKISRAIAEAA